MGMFSWFKEQLRWNTDQTFYPVSNTPRMLEVFGLTGSNYSGINVEEANALSIPAVGRAVDLITDTVAPLPTKSYFEAPDGTAIDTDSWLDDPTSGLMTPLEFKHMIYRHYVLWNDAFIRLIRNNAGQVIGGYPIHPSNVTEVKIDWGTMQRSFKVVETDGTTSFTKPYSDYHILQIPGKSSNPYRGRPLFKQFEEVLGTMIAAQRSAAADMDKGGHVDGVLTPDEPMEREDIVDARNEIDEKVLGWKNAGHIPILGHPLKFSSWQMSARDQQLVQLNEFFIAQCGRIWGIPPFELMADGVSMFGTGTSARQRGLSRQTLSPLAERVDQRLSQTVGNASFWVETDFHGLERPTPEEEAQLLNTAVQGGWMTPNEARKVRNLPPLTGGDDLRGGSQPVNLEPTDEQKDVGTLAQSGG